MAWGPPPGSLKRISVLKPLPVRYPARRAADPALASCVTPRSGAVRMKSRSAPARSGSAAVTARAAYALSFQAMATVLPSSDGGLGGASSSGRPDAKSTVRIRSTESS